MSEGVEWKIVGSDFVRRTAGMVWCLIQGRVDGAILLDGGCERRFYCIVCNSAR